MFTDTDFWKNDLVEAFLTSVPKGRVLVLDLQSEQFPQYERTHSFFGQPFIWCMLHNFGGTLGMHGSADIVYNVSDNPTCQALPPTKILFTLQRIGEARSHPNLTMVGVGITPEGINQNHVMYEYVLELAWSKETPEPDSWFKFYSISRYGREFPESERAWELLLKSVYSYRGLTKLRGKYTISIRPSLKIIPWVSRSFSLSFYPVFLQICKPYMQTVCLTLC